MNQRVRKATKIEVGNPSPSNELRSEIQGTKTENCTLVENRDSKCRCGVTLDNESCDKSLNVFRMFYKRYSPKGLKEDYLKLLEYESDENMNRQIGKDIERTHPLIPYFAKGSHGIASLERVLQCVAKYDMSIGYVQGMNYMIAGLLYHSEEYVAFWNFNTAYEQLELKDLYKPKLPGLSKHNQILQLLLMSYDLKLYTHLRNNQIQMEILLTPILFSLFGMVIPLEQYIIFFQNLVKQNWSYAYKVILNYFKSIRDELLQLEGPELLMYLSRANQHMQTTEEDPYFQRWVDAMQSAGQINIDEKFVKQMLEGFNEEKQQFKGNIIRK